ncbi:MAG: Flp pilus assembly complex ATPase component TadA [Planctomycetes bacterium]|nr:Flp pilus assembly complex ATPase component TadA [Planctomycetota bacterium]MCC7170290.1 Flp pilus assembly complex ATPase component TadA [Planctomycetota bacterium]
MAQRKLLGQILKEMRKIHEGHIQEALQIQRKQGGAIGEILVGLGAINRQDLAKALGLQAGMEVVDLDVVEPSKDALAKIDGTTATLLRVMPVRLEGKRLTVALADPLNASCLDELRFLSGCEVIGAIADEKAIEKALAKHYGADDVRSMKNAVEELKKEAASSSLNLDDKAALAHAAPVVKLLNYILYQAIKDRASDIHLEPFQNEFRVRYRVDGVLYEMEPPPVALAIALISRVKVMANLDIAETRIPQDGRIELAIGGRPVDLRVSTLPTAHGESCVMRVLDRSVVQLDLENLGLRADDLASIRRLAQKPNGIVLVTGPTGSGKTTTLYSVLQEVNEIDTKVITTEDPVEYDLDGIIQIPINDEIEVTYARVLRTILRQDPDIILVGEIRDRETAQIAVEAALTGHLVFSTLHTNDAPSAVMRLVDVGVEPFLISATLEGIVAQRLVRRICPECREAYQPDPELLRELELDPAQIAGKTFFYGRGCDKCNFSGFKGRRAIYEIMPVTERIKRAVLEKASGGRLRELAIEEGMRPLRAAGLLAIFDGITTVEEVLRETVVER